MKVRDLNHVAIHVADVERSRRFYRDDLGLPELPRPAFGFPGAWFRLGERQELHLIGDRLPGPVTSRSRTGHFALRVADLDQAARFLRGRGVAFAPPVRRPDQARQIFLEDPDGHLVELMEPPTPEP